MADVPLPRRILARTFVQALCAAGAIPGNPLTVRRVVIDAKADSVLVIHVEYLGDERALEVARTLEGVVITREERPAAGNPGEWPEIVLPGAFAGTGHATLPVRIAGGEIIKGASAEVRQGDDGLIVSVTWPEPVIREENPGG